MKIAITANDNKLSSNFDKRFGRAPWFCIYDETTKEKNWVKNEFADSSNGAGIKVAEIMMEKKVERVISGDFGPKAKEKLDQFNIQMVCISADSLTVQDVINKIK